MLIGNNKMWFATYEKKHEQWKQQQFMIYNIWAHWKTMKPLKGLSDTSKQPKTKIQAIRKVKLAHGVRNLTKEIITLDGFSFSHKLNVFRYQQLVNITFNYYNINKGSSCT